MNIAEAIRTRKSIRKFKPDNVSKEILKEILEIACRAPSSVNQQPWEFAVVAGGSLERIKQANVEMIKQGRQAQRDYPPEDRPKDSIYRKRQVDLAMQLFEVMGIPREDKEKRYQWLERGFRYFDAPAAIFVYTDSCLGGAQTLLDIGAVMQNICLAAMKFGLGTCIENQGIQYSDMIREQLGLPDSKKIAVSIAIGYPDWDFPANQLISDRENVDNISIWSGF